jgi:hypothetical protein
MQPYLTAGGAINGMKRRIAAARKTQKRIHTRASKFRVKAVKKKMI